MGIKRYELNEAQWARIAPLLPGIYKHRNQIERCFGRMKHFRRFATRYDRRTIHFTGFVHLAAAMIWLR
jgi:transposase